MYASGSSQSGADVVIVVDPAVISSDAVLKTCYWFARYFSSQVNTVGGGRLEVRLHAKDETNQDIIAHAEHDFTQMAMDFELRCRIESRTSAIRELLLAKALAESGVLEDSPSGDFDDPVEKAKPEGLFNILQAHQF